MCLTKSAAGLVLCVPYLLFAALCIVHDLRRTPTPLILHDTTSKCLLTTNVEWLTPRFLRWRAARRG